MLSILSAPNPFWDPEILGLFNGIQAQLSNGAFVGTAKNLAAVVSIIYLSVRAYAMIIGEGTIQIMQLFRPFVIILVILNFTAFANIVGSIGKAAEGGIKGRFEHNANMTNALLTQKEDLTKKLTLLVEENKQRLIEERVKTESAKRKVEGGGGGDSWIGEIEESINDFGNALLQSLVLEAQLAWARLSLFIQELITNITLAIFKGIAYCMFFIQLILMHIMLILGPISFAISIAGPFKDSWVQWVKRYIAISFYATITFIVLNIALAIVQYGFEQEISRLNYIMESKDVINEFLAKVTDIGSYLGLLIIAVLTTLGGILQIPTVAGWVVSGGDGGAVMFGAAAGAGKSVARGGMGAGRALATAGAGPIGNAAGGIASTIGKGAVQAGKGLGEGAKQSASTISKSINTMRK